jgi:hypothetical protein
MEVMAPPNSAPQYRQDSMTMAEVGDIVKVSGNKIATPLAPPKPGSTPMSTPKMMPTNIKPKFMGVRITAKPCSREFSSSISTHSGGANRLHSGSRGSARERAQAGV